MGVVERKHQLCREGAHPVVHDDRIVAVELVPVIDVIERMVEVNCRLCREDRRQPPVAALDKGVLRLFEQVVSEHPEGVEMQFGIGMG